MSNFFQIHAHVCVLIIHFLLLLHAHLIAKLFRLKFILKTHLRRAKRALILSDKITVRVLSI